MPAQIGNLIVKKGDILYYTARLYLVTSAGEKWVCRTHLERRECSISKKHAGTGMYYYKSRASKVSTLELYLPREEPVSNHSHVGTGILVIPPHLAWNCDILRGMYYWKISNRGEYDIWGDDAEDLFARYRMFKEYIETPEGPDLHTQLVRARGAVGEQDCAEATLLWLFGNKTVQNYLTEHDFTERWHGRDFVEHHKRRLEE